MKKPTPDELLVAIHKYCLDCCGGKRKIVRQCKSRDCALWAYRGIQTRDRIKPMRGQLSLFDLMSTKEKGV